MKTGAPQGSATHDGLLLAGGRSTRFLPDKMRELVWEKPLHRYGLEALSTCCPLIWLSTGASGRYVAEELSAAVPVQIIADDHPGQGPLEGIRSVMLQSRATHLLVLAGDLPGVRPATLRQLLEAPEADVVCARDAESGRWQPLCARWSRSLLDPLTRSLQDGQRGVQRFLADHRVLTIDVSADELHNVNRPSDLPGRLSR